MAGSRYLPMKLPDPDTYQWNWRIRISNQWNCRIRISTNVIAGSGFLPIYWPVPDISYKLNGRIRIPNNEMARTGYLFMKWPNLDTYQWVCRIRILTFCIAGYGYLFNEISGIGCLKWQDPTFKLYFRNRNLLITCRGATLLTQINPDPFQISGSG